MLDPILLANPSFLVSSCRAQERLQTRAYTHDITPSHRRYIDDTRRETADPAARGGNGKPGTHPKRQRRANERPGASRNERPWNAYPRRNTKLDGPHRTRPHHTASASRRDGALRAIKARIARSETNGGVSLARTNGRCERRVGFRVLVARVDIGTYADREARDCF